MQGVSVDVYTPNVTGADRLNNPVYGTPSKTTVGNVLVAPGSTSDIEAGRPDGVTVDLTLHFPKTYSGDLRGCEIDVPGYGRFKVIGEPKPYMGENTPTDWHMPVEVEACHG